MTSRKSGHSGLERLHLSAEKGEEGYVRKWKKVSRAYIVPGIQNSIHVFMEVSTCKYMFVWDTFRNEARAKNAEGE